MRTNKWLFSVVAGATMGLAGVVCGAVDYGSPGSAYLENFDVLSSTAAPSGGYGWQQGASTSNNTLYNGAGGSAGIAGFYTFASNISGATPSMQDTVTGPRNFIGPDGTTPSAWSSVNSYYAGDSLTSGSRLMSFGGGTTNVSINPSSDRALGVTAGSTAHTATNGLWPGDNYMALVLRNTTGQQLDHFTLSYYGQRWVDNLAVSQTLPNAVPDLTQKGLLFTCKTTSTFTGDVTDIVTVPDDTSPYDASQNNGGMATNGFQAVTALDDTYALPTTGGGRVDGNLTLADNGVDNRRLRTATIDTPWAPQDYLILRWFENDDAGNEIGIGIDDLSFSADVVPEPAGALLLGLTLPVLLRRRRQHG